MGSISGASLLTNRTSMPAARDFARQSEVKRGGWAGQRAARGRRARDVARSGGASRREKCTRAARRRACAGASGALFLRATRPRQARAPDITLNSALRDSEALRGRDAELRRYVNVALALPFSCELSPKPQEQGPLPRACREDRGVSEAAAAAESPLLEHSTS
jgi:hypothetical protein